MLRVSTAFILGLTLCLGCGGGGDEPTPDTPEPQPQADPQASTVVPPPALPPSPPAEDPGAQPAVSDTAKPAVAGVGRKGRDYGTGPVATPVAAYFGVRERIAFLQIVTPMNMYRVTNGHFPESHEEFIREIIEANSIKLPELPSGEQYRYDPKKAASQTSYDQNDPPLLVVPAE